MKLWHKVALGLILGIIFGVYLPQYVEALKPIGTIFLRLIKMVIIPLIFFSILAGITSMKDPTTFSRVGIKSVLLYFGTTCFAVIFGLSVAHVLQPGTGVVINFGSMPQLVKEVPFNLVEFLINIVPNNIFESLANASLLQVVFFSIFAGIVINGMGTSADPLRNIIQSAAKMVLSMISKIVQLSPYAAFALIAWVVGTQGFGIMVSLSKLIGAIVIAFALQYVIFGLFILIFCRISPIPFYKKSFEYQMIAFSTGSSKASLATTMKVCRERLGVSQSSTDFVLPLGAAINMDGLAIKLGLCAIFFAQVMGVHLHMSDYLLIVLMATLGSIGGAGIPGSFIIMLPVVLSSVHLPIEGVALLVGVDRLLDLLSTTINITGDATKTVVIDASEGTLDKARYYSNGTELENDLASSPLEAQRSNNPE